jgi:bifunctional non-homologous end joining protein LigD
LAHVPRFRPQLATLVDRPPHGPEWLHEVKFDGYRIACTVENGRARLESRRNVDWTARLSEIAEAALHLPVASALLDGEVAIVMASGLTSFQSLQNAFSGAPRRGLTYFVFDLLHLDGRDLAALPLVERRRECERILGRQSADSPIRYSQHFDVDGAELLARMCALGGEGIVSKRRDQPYRPGRNDGWLKSKCLEREELVVGGFTAPSGARTGIGALLVGYWEGAELRFAGKVGTGPGFTAEYLSRLRRELAPLEQPHCPFEPPPPGWIGRQGHWVRPVRSGIVTFTEWTDAGTLRHPSFQGFLDRDVPGARRSLPELSAALPPATPPSAPRRSSAAPRPSAPRPTAMAARSVLGVTISTPDRVVYPALNFTKADLAAFYADVARWMLPYVANRPLTLVRCDGPIAAGVPGETCRFLPHSSAWYRWATPPIRRVQIPEQKKLGEYLIVDSPEALIALVQGDIVEVHVWNSTADRIETPDRLVLDLDPGDGVSWPQIVAAAMLVRGLLRSLGLASWPKLTGGKGVHVVVPFLPEHGWPDVYALSYRLAQAALERDPGRFTLDFAKDKRRNKIPIDYKRNHRGAVAVAAYSTRARPNGAVGVPLSWRELAASRSPDRWTVRTLHLRLRRLRLDPWREFWSCRQRLTR